MALQSHIFPSVPVGRAVRGSVLCGKYSSTLRKVRFGTAHGVLAFSAFSGFAVRSEKLFFSFRQFFFPWGADFFHRSDGWAGCLFVRTGSRSGAKVQRRAPFFPAFLNFLIKNNRVSLEGLKICFTAAFLVVWRSFHTFTELFRLKKVAGKFGGNGKSAYLCTRFREGRPQGCSGTLAGKSSLKVLHR